MRQVNKRASRSDFCVRASSNYELRLHDDVVKDLFGARTEKRVLLRL